MNIFYIQETPREIATSLHDKHVVKMLLETGQMLCTALHLSAVFNTPYRPTHHSHPMVRWVASGRPQFRFTCKLGFALSNEYTHRYGKVHATASVIDWCADQLSFVPNGEWRDPPQCVPDEFFRETALEAYRDYYLAEKVGFDSKWTNREVPAWIAEAKGVQIKQLQDS